MKSFFLTLSVKSSDEDDEGWRAMRRCSKLDPIVN